MEQTKQPKAMSLLKCSFLAICLFAGVGGVNVYADEANVSRPIILNVRDDNPTQAKGGRPRTPIQAPSVTLDDHTLYTGSIWFDALLELVDEDGDVTYTALVPQGTPSVTFPSSLSGSYELRLIWGNWCFYGLIEL